MVPPSLSLRDSSTPSDSSSLATYTRLVDLYSPLRRASTPTISTISESPPPAYTSSNRVRARTIDSTTELRRSKRRHLNTPLESGAITTPLPLIKYKPKSTSRVKRIPAPRSSTSLRLSNNQAIHHKPKPYNTPPEDPSHDTQIDNMSFLNPSTNYLSAIVEVLFENDGLVEMVGGPNTGSSYSLSGHIILSMPGLPRGSQSRIREVKELMVTMESMTDYHDDHGRYTPYRLHTYTSNLAEEPLTIPESSRPTDTRIFLTIPFDLRLPGWLPPSHISQMTKVEHGVTAKAIIAWTPTPDSEIYGDIIALDDALVKAPITRRANFNNYFFPNASLSPRTTCTSSSKHTIFTVLRHRLPASITQLDRPNERQYTLKPEADPDSPVECVVLCPDWVDVNGPERSLKIALRLRAKRSDLDITLSSSTPSSSQSSINSGFPTSSSADTAGSIPMLRSGKAGSGLNLKTEDPYTHVLELGMEVEEVERFSSTPITSWGQSFPVPRDQPNRSRTVNPLLSTRSTYADIGIVMQNDTRPHRSATSRSCLLADDGTQRNFFFADDGLALADKWRKVNVVLPMPAVDSKSGSNRPQSELDSPFLRVRHNLKIKMVCRNSGTDETKVITLTTPIRFGTLPSTHPDSKLKADTHLPAYIQLFHENGDLRECDPLPLYSRDGPEEDIIMAEPTITPPPSLPAIKPVSAGVPPLPPLAIRRATSPARQIEIPAMEEDDSMEGDSSDSEDSTSDTSSSSSGSSGRMSIDGSVEEDEQSQVLAREAEYRAERERERQRERDRDRLRRMELQRERQRETRNQAPPPTPRTPGGRKLARNPRSVRAVGGL